MEPMVMELNPMEVGEHTKALGGVIILLFALLINVAFIIGIVIALVSLVRIASGMGKLERKLDEIKCELEKQNRTE